MLINKYSKENESDTPGFILAQYLKGCLANYVETVKFRIDEIAEEVTIEEVKNNGWSPAAIQSAIDIAKDAIMKDREEMRL